MTQKEAQEIAGALACPWAEARMYGPICEIVIPEPSTPGGEICVASAGSWERAIEILLSKAPK